MRQMSTPCWLRKCSSSSFVLCTPSAFQQARRWVLLHFVVLGHAAVFGQKRVNGLQDSPRASCPCGDGGGGREGLMSLFHKCLEGEAMEEIRNILKCGGGTLGGVHPVGICVFSRCGFDTCSCFLVFPNSRLSGCCGFGLGLLSPRRLPGGGHLRLLGRFRDWLRSGFWIGIGRWCGGGLDNTPSPQMT